MKKWPFLLVMLVIAVSTTDSSARRTYLTPEQKAQLEKVQTVFVNVLALTERGRADAAPMTEIVKRRMEELDYTVVLERKQPHDVELRVKCEERKKWEGTTRAGGDAELADAPARLWKGPACLFSYKLGGKDLEWYKETRTDFEEPIAAAKSANVKDSGAYALSQLQTNLKTFDFPVLVSAEWGQIDRLIKLLDNTETPKLRKVKVLTLLSELNADEALPRLQEAMKDKDLTQEVIVAIGGAGGTESIPLLVDLFQNSKQSSIKAAAAKALGKVANTFADHRPIPPLVEYVKELLPRLKSSEDIDFPVLTQVVWAIGKHLWEPSLQPITELQTKIWLIRDTSPEMAELREATNWTYKQLDLEGMIS